MILWLILFGLVIAISIVLAAQSMRDYHEIPTKDEEYGLFLIRQTSNLTLDLLNSLHDDLLKSKTILSFERLIKGEKSALVIFASKNIQDKYKDILSLLEIEDYTNVNIEQISAWEVGIVHRTMDNGQKIFSAFPSLSNTEQFWWQLILSAKKDLSFQVNIRAILVCSDEAKRKSLTDILQNLAPEAFIKLPKASSNTQLIDFYQKRSSTKSSNIPPLNSSEVLSLLTV